MNLTERKLKVVWRLNPKPKFNGRAEFSLDRVTKKNKSKNAQPTVLPSEHNKKREKNRARIVVVNKA